MMVASSNIMDSVAELATDKRARSDMWSQNKKEITSYMMLLFLIGAVWSTVSSGEFSFSLTLGSVISMFSFLIMAICIHTGGSASGISAKMLEVGKSVIRFLGSR